jgi:hypothetical protein
VAVPASQVLGDGLRAAVVAELVEFLADADDRVLDRVVEARWAADRPP